VVHERRDRCRAIPPIRDAVDYEAGDGYVVHADHQGDDLEDRGMRQFAAATFAGVLTITSEMLELGIGDTADRTRAAIVGEIPDSTVE
jgi:hypothetical protein